MHPKAKSATSKTAAPARQNPKFLVEVGDTGLSTMTHQGKNRKTRRAEKSFQKKELRTLVTKLRKKIQKTKALLEAPVQKDSDVSGDVKLIAVDEPSSG